MADIWSTSAVGDLPSELGKLLVVGSVRAFYARAKEAKKRQVWDIVGHRKETRYGSLEMSLFCEDRP